jgi:hypothetical protein
MARVRCLGFRVRVSEMVSTSTHLEEKGRPPGEIYLFPLNWYSHQCSIDYFGMGTEL